MTFVEKHREFLNDWQEGTCVWFQSEPDFIRWAHGEIKTLWCRGGRGAGKTILMATVFENLKKKDLENTAILQIYLANRDQEQQTSANLIPALLRQLVEQTPSLSPTLADWYDRHCKSGTRPLAKDYAPMLRSEAARFERVYIIIDGLDECRGQTRLDLLTLVNQVLESHVDAHLLVSSRLVDEVGSNLKDAVKLDIQAKTSDMGLYIASYIKEMANLRTLTTRYPDLANEIEDTVTGKASGMFLLAKLHLQLLESCEQRTKKRFSRFLHSLPLALEDTYKEVWLQIETQGSDKFELAKSVLTWVCYSREPLEATALQHALFATQTQDLEYIDEEDLEDPNDLVQVCNGLVVRHKESDIVRFEHYTADEFFPGFLANTLPAAQSTIARACLRYLSMRCVTDIGNSIPFGYTPYTYSGGWNKPYPLVRYAATSWGYHANRAEIDQGIPLDFVLEFLGRPRPVKFTARVLDVCQTPEAEFGQRNRVIGLHLASFFGLRRAADQLISAKPSNLEFTDSFGWSALRWACHGRKETMVEYLIEKGGKIGSMDRAGNTSLMWALGRRETYVSYRNVAISAGSFANSNAIMGTEDLPRSDSFDSDLESSEELFDDADPNSQDVTEQPHTTSRHGHHPNLAIVSDGTSPVQISQLISLEFGQLQDASTFQDGPEPLRTSAEIVDLLIHYSGESINARGADARTALSLAAENQQFDIVNKLLRQGADFESVDQHNSVTPLLWALQSPRRSCNFRNVSISGPVVAHLGYSIHVLTKPNGGTEAATSRAALTGSQNDILLRLIGRNPDAVDFNGRTALSLAAESGYVEVVDALIRRNADINLADNQGMTPLMYASTNFSSLKSSYRNVSISDDAVVFMGNLIYGSIDQNTEHSQTDFINTRMTIVNMLLDAGADIDCQNNEGRTALDLARQPGWGSIWCLLFRRKRMQGPEPDERSFGEILDEDTSTLEWTIHFNNMNVDGGAVWIGRYAVAGSRVSTRIHQGLVELTGRNFAVTNAMLFLGSYWLKDEKFLKFLAQKELNEQGRESILAELDMVAY